MNVIYKEGRDKNLPNWRISVSFILLNGIKYILVKSENFEMGFTSGESWNKVYSGKNGKDTYDTYVSVITKDKSLLESFKPLIIDEFYKILEYNIKVYDKDIKRINVYIDECKDCLVSDLFKQKLRDEVLNKLLGDV